jgi:hypothetical protein
MFGSRRQRGKKTRALRLYFATDIHGSDVCFRKFLAAAKVYEPDALILGGDFAGKALVPVLAEDGDLTARIEGQRVTVPAAEWDQLAADATTGPGSTRWDLEAAGARRAGGRPGRPGPALPQRDPAQLQRWCDLAGAPDPGVRCTSPAWQRRTRWRPMRCWSRTPGECLRRSRATWGRS